jgi:hypothetical protein
MLTEEADSQHRCPDRHREFDGNHLCQGNQAQGEEPPVLRAVVQQIARDVLQWSRRFHGCKSAAHANQWVQHEQADERAHLHDLKNSEFLRRLAPGDCHDQHRRSHPAIHTAAFKLEGFGFIVASRQALLSGLRLDWSDLLRPCRSSDCLRTLQRLLKAPGKSTGPARQIGVRRISRQGIARSKHDKQSRHAPAQGKRYGP